MMRRLKDLVADELRRQIFDGKLQPGAHIRQEALAKELKVSRMPVREAILELSDEGLIDYAPRTGAYVTQLTKQDVLDHFELYGLVGGLAAGRAARNRTHDDIRDLAAILDELESPTLYSRQVNNLNVRFHSRVNRASQSPRIVRVLATIGRAMPTLFFAQQTKWKSKFDQEHREILAALLDQDADRAEKAIRQHLRGGAEMMVDYLTERGILRDEFDSDEHAGSRLLR